MPFGYNKPIGMILIYPLISTNQKYGNLPAFYNLLGTDTPNEEQIAECSLEKHVSRIHFAWQKNTEKMNYCLKCIYIRMHLMGLRWAMR